MIDNQLKNNILKLLHEAETWLKFHRARNQQIEALGAVIRINALKDVLKLIECLK